MNCVKTRLREINKVTGMIVFFSNVNNVNDEHDICVGFSVSLLLWSVAIRVIYIFRLKPNLIDGAMMLTIEDK